MNTIYSHRGLTDPDFITKLKNSKFLLEVEKTVWIIFFSRGKDESQLFHSFSLSSQSSLIKITPRARANSLVKPLMMEELWDAFLHHTTKNKAKINH